MHPRVVRAGPNGSVFSKDDDLVSYRSGSLRVDTLVEKSVDVQDDGQTGVTRMVAAVDAVQGGDVVSAPLRHTRLWVREDHYRRVSHRRPGLSRSCTWTSPPCRGQNPAGAIGGHQAVVARPHDYLRMRNVLR